MSSIRLVALTNQREITVLQIYTLISNSFVEKHNSHDLFDQFVVELTLERESTKLLEKLVKLDLQIALLEHRSEGEVEERVKKGFEDLKEDTQAFGLYLKFVDCIRLHQEALRGDLEQVKGAEVRLKSTRKKLNKFRKERLFDFVGRVDEL